MAHLIPIVHMTIGIGF